MKRPIIVLSSAVLLLASLPLGAETRRYALILEDPPVVAKIASRSQLRSPAALDAEARIASAQESLRQQLAERKIPVTGSVKILLNAVFVVASDPQRLQGLPGVQRVVRLQRMHLHLNRALPLVQTPEGWTALAAAGFPNAGAGMKIGILDTGIDQNHPGLQDPSLPPPDNLPVCGHSPGQLGNNDCGYTNSKVIVARSYITMDAAANQFDILWGSQPDDYSPRDRVGHGTAAAVTAAGIQHQAPLAAISGVAPKAYLGNYKIYGSPGVNDGIFGDALVAAIEDAYRDRMDIVSLSVGISATYTLEDTGAACGNPSGRSCEVEVQAVESAVQNGMAVVVSAGNDGDTGLKFPTLNSVNSPGTAPSAVTVGASRNGHVLYSKVGLTAADAPGNLRNLYASYGDGLRVGVAAPLRDVASLGNDGLACAALSAGSLNGAIALVQRDPAQCDFTAKARNAKNAGAVGLVIYREEGSGAAGDRPIPPLGLTGIGIPGAMIGNTDGHSLKTYLQSHPDAPAVMDPALTAYDDPSVSTVATFSSRGPSIAGSSVKPELVAPGTGIYTATQKYDTNSEVYNSTGYTVMEGTSIGAPMVAGALALVKQKNPGFSPAQLKSAVVNTASGDVQDDGPAHVTAVGAGKLNVQAAVQTNVTVSPATLSFGALAAAMFGTPPTSLALTVYNDSASPLTLAVEPAGTDPNARLELSKTTVAAGPARTDTVAVYLRGSLPAAGAYEGAVTIKGGAVDLRVPYLYLVGDNIAYNLFPTFNSDFVDPVNQADFIQLRAIDRYGLPALLAPVTWRGTQGGTTIDTSVFDPRTAKYGVAGALVYMGPSPGDQEFTATVANGTSQPLVLVFSGRARALPTIDPGGVIDAASGQAPQSGRGLAPGSYASVWGQNLAENSMGFDTFLPAGIDPYLPISLGGTRVSFDVPSRNLSVPGHLSYAGPRQINVQIPWELAGNAWVLMKVSVGSTDSDLYTVFLSDSAPGVFEYPLGSGMAVAQDPFTGGLFTTQQPAPKDQWVTLYVNGLGPVDKTPASGDMTPAQGLARCTKTVAVTIGGKTATVDFAGLTPTGIGYYQINLKVPADAPSGNQPLVVSADGVPAKTVNLPIQ